MPGLTLIGLISLEKNIKTFEICLCNLICTATAQHQVLCIELDLDDLLFALMSSSIIIGASVVHFSKIENDTENFKVQLRLNETAYLGTK